VVAATLAGCTLALGALAFGLHCIPRRAAVADEPRTAVRSPAGPRAGRRVEPLIARRSPGRVRPAPPAIEPPRQTLPGKGTEKPSSEPRPDAPRPLPEKKPSPPRPREVVELSEADLGKQLLRVAQVDFFGLVERLNQDGRQGVAERLRRVDLTGSGGADRRRLIEEAGRVQFAGKVTVAVLEEARRQGLPVRVAAGCKVDSASAVKMQALSRAFRDNQFVSTPGLPRDLKAVQRFDDWLASHPLGDDPAVRRILWQMLQVEDEAKRQLLVKELARGKDREAVTALAGRALFDLSPRVRDAAIAELKRRDPASFRAVLLAGLRYPWAAVADQAARALVQIDDRQAVPALLELLDRPDPALPVLDPQGRRHVVRELVRVRHLGNCYLCHADAPVQEAPVAGLVPPDGHTVVPASRYYRTVGRPSMGKFVRADVTFLRQDFSIVQPAPGLPPQRFDFLVRTREATAEEMVRLKKPPPQYPQREAVLYALRRLTGKDFGTTTQQWVEGLGVGRPKEPAPPELPAQAGPGGLKGLQTELAALGVGPRAKPHRQAASPDGKLVATVVGNRVAITRRGAPTPLLYLGGHTAPVTSVWWDLDGDSISSDDTQGLVVTFDATSGKQRSAFYKN
jgi:hypothetical protein